MVTAYCPLLYGASYLKQAIDSVAPFADRIVILYTRQPSFGHGTSLRCPDSEESLRACTEHLGKQVSWHVGEWVNEGTHRNAILDIAPDAEIILPIDSDELWDREALTHCIAEARKSTARNFLIGGWNHFWRSFAWVCSDVWQPVRIVKPRGSGDASLQGRVYHFGYAISEELMRFKWSCHGHKNELRPEWLEEIFMANRRTDCHPVVRDWWTAQPFDTALLPASLREHPNFGKELIR